MTMPSFMMSMFLVLGTGLPAAGQTQRGAAVGELRIAVGEKATPPERRAAELLAAEVKRRTGIEARIGGGEQAGPSVVLGTAQSGAAVREFSRAHPEVARLGADGFCLETKPDARRRRFVVGQSPSGVVAGVGKLLRLMTYEKGALTIPPVSLADTPKLPVRGIYFATHFFNFYHVAPLAEVDRIIEEFALWGGNSLCVWFDMHHFTGISDPAAQAHLARLRHFAETAHGVGMQFGLTFIADEAYANSPAALRPKPAPGSYGVELCPSIPEGLALIGKWQAEELDAFPQVDFIWTWPYDQGGCACDQCKPWGANGFLKASEQLSRLYHQHNPHGKVWLSTWLFDDIAGNIGEYAGLWQVIKEKQPAWFDGIVAGTHGDGVPAPLLDRPEPERYPLTWFPEISMWGMEPWGGYGANPLPAIFTHLKAHLGSRTQGGWPYSEGIYEDLNKWLWCRDDWSPDSATDDLLAEYASYYLCPAAAEDGVKLFHLLEQTHQHTNWRARNLAQADEAWALAQSIDGRLPEYAKKSWRWRLLYVRAAIDHLLKTEGYRTPEAQAALKPYADELVALYHAQNSFIRPPAFPEPRVPGDNLAEGRMVTASSVHPDYPGCEQSLTNGVYAQEDGEDFWVDDVHKEKTSWVSIDLGKPAAIKEVRLQYRGIYGNFWFIPTTVSFAVSQDGVEWTDAGTSTQVPVEGTPYSPKLWAYPIGKEGRFVRITLGPSQHVAEPFPGTLELVEVEVGGQ